MNRFLLALLLFTTAAYAQTDHDRLAQQPSPDLSEFNTTLHSKADRLNPTITGGTWTGATLMTPSNHDFEKILDTFPQNPSRVAALASTYLGSDMVSDTGHSHGTHAHYYIEGETRGWDEGTCVVGVMANAPTNAPGCSQGGFGDMAYRQAYGGQDSTGMFVYAQGLVPVARAAPVKTFGSVSLFNLAKVSQSFATVVFSSPLSPAQVAAINAVHGPMRVETNNHFFGYVIPQGLTNAVGQAVPPASEDGASIIVDNWTRATPHEAAPTLPYVTAGTAARAGTGVYPNQIGQTARSAPLHAYSVTIDFNKAMDAFGATLRTDNADALDTLRVLEFGAVNNKTGPQSWDDNEPLNDSTNGEVFTSHLFFGGCQNDDGVGNGACGALAYAAPGLKRGYVCANVQNSIGIGGTSCVLDTKTTYGYKSTKTTGYVLWIDPENKVSPVFVLDSYGNISSKGNIELNGTASMKIAGLATMESGVRNTGSTNGYMEQDLPSGTNAGTYVRDIAGNSAQIGQITASVVTAKKFLNTAVVTVKALPACDSSTAGARMSVSDALSVAFLRHVVGGGKNFSPVICSPDGAWLMG